VKKKTQAKDQSNKQHILQHCTLPSVSLFYLGYGAG
jgi:hypothetical protein